MKSLIMAIITLFLLVNLPDTAFSKTTLKGTLLGADGRPMITADILVIIYGEKRDYKMYSPDKEGKFEFTIPDEGIYSIQFAGVNHMMKEIPFIVPSSDETLTLNITLEPYKLKDNLNDLKIIGSFNSFNFSKDATKLEPQPDGTYAASVNNSTDTLYYQVMGATEPMRSINGTMGTFYSYDGNGDYYTAIVSKDKPIKVVFDPRKMKMDYKPVSVTSPDENLNRYFQVLDKFAQVRRETNTSLATFAENDEQDKLKDLVTSSLKNIENEAEAEKDMRIKQFMLLEYFDLASGAVYNGLEDKVSKKLVGDIIKLIPATSKVWTKYYQMPAVLYRIAGEEITGEFIDKLIREHPEERLRKAVQFDIQTIIIAKKAENKTFVEGVLKTSEFPDQLLYQAVDYAYKNGLKDEGEVLYKMLRDKYPDSKASTNAKYEFDEDRAIQKGKKIPDFKLDNLDVPGETITPETLKGKYVLIDLWATWCGPCIAEMDNLQSIYDKYKSKNFEIFSISFDRNSDFVKRFRSGKWKMPWLHSYSEGIFDSEMAKTFEVIGIPKPILIDPKGKIVALEEDLRGRKLDKTLEKLLK